jgi:hypothetical protein
MLMTPIIGRGLEQQRLVVRGGQRPDRGKPGWLVVAPELHRRGGDLQQCADLGVAFLFPCFDNQRQHGRVRAAGERFRRGQPLASLVGIDFQGSQRRRDGAAHPVVDHYLALLAVELDLAFRRRAQHLGRFRVALRDERADRGDLFVVVVRGKPL